MLNKFIKRMERLGIKLECSANLPWIYLDKVNGNTVEETFLAEHGFTIAFATNSNAGELTNVKEIIKIIRKYK